MAMCGKFLGEEKRPYKGCKYSCYRVFRARRVVKPSFIQRNPRRLAEELGQRLRRVRLSRGWTQEELAERAGVGLSSVKNLEGQGKTTLVRLLQVASVLGVIDECLDLFVSNRVAESLEAAHRAERKRAPRRDAMAPNAAKSKDKTEEEN